ncbi:MAG: DUF5615 family PIN-like protein [Hyphococcus sp.]
MRFLIDAQLPPNLAERLRKLGHEAEHVAEIGMGNAKDTEIWAQAIASGSVIVSKDQDFAERATYAREKAPVIWIRLGNTTSVTLWRIIEPSLAEIMIALKAGEMLIEIT